MSVVKGDWIGICVVFGEVDLVSCYCGRLAVRVWWPGIFHRGSVVWFVGWISWVQCHIWVGEQVVCGVLLWTVP